jgi:hypothetical protein
MLSALCGDGFDAFLQVGGASTIRSYVDSPFGDVAAQFIAAVPPAHIRFLRSLEDVFDAEGLLAAHTPNDLARLRAGRNVFGACGHTPQQLMIPTITNDTAYLDTGSGTWPQGRLTCLLWPSLRWIQQSSPLDLQRS